MKRLLEIFIFFFAFTYADGSDTDVNHLIIDHKGNSIQAIIDSIDLDNVYYQSKLKKESEVIDIDKVYFIFFYSVLTSSSLLVCTFLL